MSETGNVQGSLFDVRSWEPARRRAWSLRILGGVVATTLVGVALWYLLPSLAGGILWALVVLTAALFLAEVAIVVMGPRAGASAASAESAAGYGPAATTAPAEAGEAEWGGDAWGDAPPAAESEVLTLRCGDCGTLFDLVDNGQRPLYHTCPGCGAEGVLRAGARGAPAVQAPAPAPAPVAEDAWAPPAEEEVAAPAPAPAAPMKKLKLRCGGCKNIFVLEDPGVRPLRHRCPHCSRAGELR